MPQEASKDLSFKCWLLMNKGMGNSLVSILASFANRLLREFDCPQDA
jgi:hypothetical protein